MGLGLPGLPAWDLAVGVQALGLGLPGCPSPEK